MLYFFTLSQKTETPPHYEAIATTRPDAVHNLIGMTALVMWPKLLNSVKSDDKVTF